MKSKLEKRLGRLEAPAPPNDLQDRCLNTIPVADATQPATLRQPARPFRLQRVALCGVLMFAVAAGVAFWNTRPAKKGATRPTGSVAFADVLEAARRVSFFHAKGRNAILDETQKNPKIKDWVQSDTWYDANKGFYNRYLQDTFLDLPDNYLPKGASKYTRTLVLPTGISYRREGTSSNFDVETDDWKMIQKVATAFLTGQISETSYLGGPKTGRILSSDGNWKGQKVKVFVLERQPSPENASAGRRPVQMRFYVNPQTKLVIAQRNFTIGAAPLLIAEYEIDYNKPDSALFDVARLTQGAAKNPPAPEFRPQNKRDSHS